jgi:hypothetical protein
MSSPVEVLVIQTVRIVSKTNVRGLFCTPKIQLTKPCKFFAPGQFFLEIHDLRFECGKRNSE